MSDASGANILEYCLVMAFYVMSIVSFCFPHGDDVRYLSICICMCLLYVS